MRAARELVDEGICKLVVCSGWTISLLSYCKSDEYLTKWLVEALVVSHGGSEGGKVKHDRPLGPVGAVRGVVGALAEQVVVCLANCDLLAPVGLRDTGRAQV